MRGLGSVAAALAVASLAGCAPDTDGTRTVTVYAAASLSDAFADLAAQFATEHPGTDVVVVHGGSSGLAAQILEGAPADVFASADEAQMEVAGSRVAEDPHVFATNTLTLVVPAGNPAGVTGLADLADPDVVSVTCAPQVPCGAATVTLAERAGVALAPASQEGSVTDVLGKVATGQADAGVVYATDVARADGVQEVEVPGADAIVSRYPIATLTDAASPDLAATFVRFTTGERGRAVLAAHGFGAP